MTKLIVFDFDGTLGDTLELILKCRQKHQGSKDLFHMSLKIMQDFAL